MAEHDPPQALFGGPDGTSVHRRRRACSPPAGSNGGGLVAIEHDDTARCDVVAVVAAHRDRSKMSRRIPTSAADARFVTARRKVAP